MLHGEMIDLGRTLIGLTDSTKSSAYNIRVSEMAKYCQIPYTNNDSWCSIFLNYLAKKSGYEYSRSSGATSWLKMGKRLPNFVEGCIVIYWRDSFISGKGHVGIGTAIVGNKIKLLSGNSSNPGQVIEHFSYPINQVLGYIQLSKNGLYTEFPLSGNQSPYFNSSESTTNNRNRPTYTTFPNNKKTTLQDFIKSYNINMKPEELLAYENNSETIFNSYNQEEKFKYKKANINLVGIGAQIKIPLIKIKSEKSVYSVNQTLVANLEYPAFIERQIKMLFNNPEYKKINIGNSDNSGSNGTIFKRINNISVWIWNKAMDYDKGSQLIDITPYIIDLSTNVGDNGGNFSIKLPHITYNVNKDSENFKLPVDHIKTKSYEGFVAKNSTHVLTDFNSTILKANFRDDNNELTKNNKFYKRKSSFFHHILQTNDLVFIRFERLGTDKVYTRDENNGLLSVSSCNLEGNTFDMIGLIDKCTITGNAANSDQSVSISGRDLSKLIIDDGVYFFPVEYAVESGEQIIKNSSKKKSGRRLVMPSVNSLNLKTNLGGIQGDTKFNFDKTQSIEEWVTFIFSQLTNIDICPDNLFSGYSERTFIVTREDRISANGDFAYKSSEANGIWQIVKLVVDKNVGQRRIADSTLSTDTGSLMNLIRKVCQKPFVEFFMDTYGDKYYFIIRKPPFSFKSFTTNFCINIFEHDIVAESIDWEDEVYSWYRLEAMGSFVEQGDGAEMINLPAVMFPEYMEIYGSKVLHVQSNYLDFDLSVSDLSVSNISAIREQSREDLDWLIETNSYLPFTRKGSITIKSDRRIKRGINIRLMGTGEIYHVDNVSNVASLGESNERSTTISVSRGMVEEYMDKYFKIVDIKHENQNNSWQVNQDIFKFFIQRKQFR